jgi:hypothetical protein
VVSLVGVQSGSGTALGYGSDGVWRPLATATARFLSEDRDYDGARARTFIDHAIPQLLVSFPADRAVVYLDAAGCRSLWPGLQDRDLEGGVLEAAIRSGRVAVLRVRADEKEVPRPAGTGDWPADGLPRKPGTINALMRLDDPDWDGVWFYASTPKVMGAKGANRMATRYTCDERSLRDDWHGLNLTEFLCRHPGPFEPEALCELSALLCRIAPTWEGTLNWPSPLHLAKAIVVDHPGRYLAQNEDDAE